MSRELLDQLTVPPPPYSRPVMATLAMAEEKPVVLPDAVDDEAEAYAKLSEEARKRGQEAKDREFEKFSKELAVLPAEQLVEQRIESLRQKAAQAKEKVTSEPAQGAEDAADKNETVQKIDQAEKEGIKKISSLPRNRPVKTAGQVASDALREIQEGRTRPYQPKPDVPAEQKAFNVELGAANIKLTELEAQGRGDTPAAQLERDRIESLQAQLEEITPPVTPQKQAASNKVGDIVTRGRVKARVLEVDATGRPMHLETIEEGKPAAAEPATPPASQEKVQIKPDTTIFSDAQRRAFEEMQKPAVQAAEEWQAQQERARKEDIEYKKAVTRAQTAALKEDASRFGAKTEPKVEPKTEQTEEQRKKFVKETQEQWERERAAGEARRQQRIQERDAKNTEKEIPTEPSKRFNLLKDMKTPRPVPATEAPTTAPAETESGESQPLPEEETLARKNNLSLEETKRRLARWDKTATGDEDEQAGYLRMLLSLPQDEFDKLEAEKAMGVQNGEPTTTPEASNNISRDEKGPAEEIRLSPQELERRLAQARQEGAAQAKQEKVSSPAAESGGGGEKAAAKLGESGGELSPEQKEKLKTPGRYQQQIQETLYGLVKKGTKTSIWDRMRTRLHSELHDANRWWWSIMAKDAKDSLVKTDKKLKDLQEAEKAFVEKSYLRTAIAPLYFGVFRGKWHAEHQRDIFANRLERYSRNKERREDDRADLLNVAAGRIDIVLNFHKERAEKYKAQADIFDAYIDSLHEENKKDMRESAQTADVQRKVLLQAQMRDRLAEIEDSTTKRSAFMGQYNDEHAKQVQYQSQKDYLLGLIDKPTPNLTVTPRPHQEIRKKPRRSGGVSKAA